MLVLLHYFAYFLDGIGLSLVLGDILRPRSFFIGELQSGMKRLHDVFFEGSDKVLSRQLVVVCFWQGAVDVLFGVWACHGAYPQYLCSTERI